MASSKSQERLRSIPGRTPPEAFETGKSTRPRRVRLGLVTASARASSIRDVKVRPSSAARFLAWLRMSSFILIVVLMHQNISNKHQYVKSIPEIPLLKAPRPSSTGLHAATGYTRPVIGERGPYVEFLPGHLIWDSFHIPDEEKYRLEHPWKDKVFYVEWRTKDQSN